MPADQETPPTKQPWPWPFNIFQEEWPEVKRAKLSFALVSVVCVFVGAAGFFGLYQNFIIPGKDSTIKQLEIMVTSNQETGKSKSVSASAKPDMVKAGTDFTVGTNFIRETQWHLKLTGIQYVPTGAVFTRVPPFRIVARVNDLDCSFPSESMFYFGVSTNRLDLQGDAVLSVSEKYKVSFHVNIFSDFSHRGILAMMKSVESQGPSGLTNWPFSSSPGMADTFDARNLSAFGTNEISVTPPYGYSSESFNGNLRIFYELSK